MFIQEHPRGSCYWSQQAVGKCLFLPGVSGCGARATFTSFSRLLDSSDALSKQKSGKTSEKCSGDRGRSRQSAGDSNDILPPLDQELPGAGAYAHVQPKGRWIGGLGTWGTQLISALLDSCTSGSAFVNNASTELVFFMARDTQASLTSPPPLMLPQSNTSQEATLE